MTPRETRYLKALLEGGSISFSQAAELETARKGSAGQDGPRHVWELAVERGFVTAAQSREVLGQIDTGSQAPVPSKGGRTELGNFELISRLGQGGMGTVYKARQKSMDRIVALKILSKNMARNQDFISRFLREARAAGKLSHPNIVIGIDAGVIDGYYYFAMEYVEGRNLGDRVRQDGPLSEDEVVEIGRQVADALQYAHGLGFVHRDVKPENILVTPSGQAKLCDLGLARSSASDEDMRVTQAGCAVGTPYYISPEQVRGQDPDARADVYSLGCTLYHLLSGRPPFQGSSPLATMQKHLTEDAPRLSEVRPEVGRAIEAVIERMMARDISERYQTARAVADEFNKITSGGIPAALTAALAERRRLGPPGLATTRKGMGASTAATRPIGARGVRTAIEPPVLGGLETTARTQPLAMVGKLKAWQVTLLFLIGSLLAGAGGFFGIQALRNRKTPPVDTIVVDPTVPVPPTEDPLKALREKLKAARDYEASHPRNYAEILLLYNPLEQEAAGTDMEAAVRSAIAEARKRQDADLAAERLRLLEEQLDKTRAFETANPEKLADILERYRKVAVDAQGTEIAAKATAAADEAVKQHAQRATKLLSQLAGRIDKDCAANRFGAALTAIDGFPAGYASVVERDLARLRETVMASGRSQWRSLLEESQKLSAAKRFNEAAAAASKGRQLGVPGLEAEVTAAISEVESARKAAAQASTAAAEQAFARFCAELPALCSEKRYADARKSGERLVGTLTPDLEARLRAQMTVIAGAEGFMKDLRAGLRQLKANHVKLSTPVGDGFIQGYEQLGDKLLVKVTMGPSSVDTEVTLAQVTPTDLLRLAAKAAGGELPAASAGGAACVLLTNSRTEGVRELLDKARSAGQKVDDIEARLSALEKAATPAPEPAPEPAPATVE